MAAVIKNVFVSHHHKDDSSVDGLTAMVAGKGYQFRNSSIRVKPENKVRIEKDRVSEHTIKRLLRMKMRWASQVIVIIGKETHSRKWVNWEIEVANQLGKPIVGIYENGLKDQVAIPENLEKYGTATVGWRSESIIGALNGSSQFQNPDGTPASRIGGVSFQC